MAALGAFNGMALGLLETPSETYKAFRAPFISSGQQSSARTTTKAGDGEAPCIRSPSFPLPSRYQSSTSSSLQMSSSHPRTLVKQDSIVSNLPPANSDIATRFGPSRSHRTDRDMLRETGPHSSRGFGRFFGTLARSPMDICISLTQGVHNLPKMWGDTSVRPQERVTDFRSGLKAVGRGTICETSNILKN
jgi:hypothetical protein